MSRIVPRSLVVSLVATTATIGLLVLGSPAIASAAVARPGTTHAPVDHAGYGSPTGKGATPTATSPSGCYQRADNPHKSSHVPGTADGVVTTTCARWVPEIAFTAQMWETRWWGWDRIGHKGSVAQWVAEKLSTTAWDTCKKNTVRVTGNGYVIDVDQRTYYASTESIHVNNPCGL